jgi:hypothetical protein
MFKLEINLVGDWQQPGHGLVYSLIVSKSSCWDSKTKRILELRHVNTKFTTAAMYATAAAPMAGAEGEVGNYKGTR